MRKQAQMTMRCMQALVRVQARVRARRLQLTHDTVHDLVDEEGGGGLEEQKLKSPMKKYEMQSRDGRHRRQQSSDKIKEQQYPSRKHDAVVKRERALAYAFAYQVSPLYVFFSMHQYLIVITILTLLSCFVKYPSNYNSNSSNNINNF